MAYGLPIVFFVCWFGLVWFGSLFVCLFVLLCFFGEVSWLQELCRGPCLQCGEQTGTVGTRFLGLSSIFHFPNYHIPSRWTRFKFPFPHS